MRYANGPIAMVDGQPVSLSDLAQRYLAGDHVVNGGPEIGLFWASNIQAHNPHRPLAEGLALIDSVDTGTRFRPRGESL
jgi:hypothetical protein